MKFEIINDKGQTLMQTTSIECIPNKDILDSMSKLGYKFKIRGKPASKKNVCDFKQKGENI